MDAINIRYNNVWKLLTDYKFDINERCYPDLICTICKRLLKNAHQNECGCRYCFECIQSYSQNKDKSCPGRTDECSDKVIDLMSDIQEDYTANKKLSMITVKCPIDGCQNTDYLVDMANHIQSHQVDCPYLEIGCNFHDVVENVNIHLNQENYAHSKLIVNNFCNFNISIVSMAEKLSQHYAEELDTCLMNYNEKQEEKIKNLQLENELFKKQLEDISNKLNQSQYTSISNGFLLATEDGNEITKCQKDLTELKKVVNTINIDNNGSRLENKNCYDDIQILERDFANYKSHINNEMSNYKEFHKQLNDDVKMLENKFKHLRRSNTPKSYQVSKSKDSHYHSNIENKANKSRYDLEKSFEDYRYEFNKMKTTTKRMEKKMDEMKTYYDKFNTNIDEIYQKLRRMQHDVDRIERTSCLENIEEFNKSLKEYFSDSAESHPKIKQFENELNLCKRDNEKVLIKLRKCQKELSTIQENHSNLEVKCDNSLQNFHSESLSIEKNGEFENYKIVIDNLQTEQIKILKSNDEINKNLEKFMKTVDTINLDNNHRANDQREIIKIIETYQLNQKEMESKTNEDLIAIKQIWNDLQSNCGTINETVKQFQFDSQIIKEEQLKMNEKLIEIDKSLRKNSIDNDKINDLLNKTAKEIVELKKTGEKYQNNTNSTLTDIKKSNEKSFSMIENLHKELDTQRSHKNKLQSENSKINQDINKIQVELRNNSTNMESIQALLVNCENNFNNLKKNVTFDYDEIKLLKKNYADSRENIKRIYNDLEQIKKDKVLLDKSNDEIKSAQEELKKLIDKQKFIDQNKPFESYVNKTKEEINNSLKRFHKNFDCKLKENQLNNEKLSQQMQILKNEFHQSFEVMNKSMASQASKFEQYDQILSKIQLLEENQKILKNEFIALSKRFLNLKTECLNRNLTPISPQVRKRPNHSRDWKVDNFKNKFQDARNDETTYLFSEWFEFSDYKVSFKLYPNGDETARNKYLSLFLFVVKRNENLPQRKFKLAISIINQENNSQIITKEYEYHNYIKPEPSLNYDLGTLEFVSLNDLFNNPSFIRNDSLLFRFTAIL